MSRRSGTRIDGVFDLDFEEQTNLAIYNNGLCSAPEYIDLKAANNFWIPLGSSLGNESDQPDRRVQLRGWY